jgi:hypothetical protein
MEAAKPKRLALLEKFKRRKKPRVHHQRGGWPECRSINLMDRSIVQREERHRGYKSGGLQKHQVLQDRWELQTMQAEVGVVFA